MTPTEHKVLDILKREYGPSLQYQAVPDMVFVDELWGGHRGGIATLRVYICKLRKTHKIKRVDGGYQYIGKDK